MTKILVIDTETTGTSETDQACEVAGVLVNADRRRIEESWTFLARPGVPVSVEARAVHHIADAELAGAAPMPAALPSRDARVVAGHNVDFDLRMLAQSGVASVPDKKICTWRCALHLWPDAPRHSNQVLRYYLGLDVPPVNGPPHRALPDAVVTAVLLMRMLEDKTPDELVGLTSAPVLQGTCRFGKNAGKPWADLPVGDLEWVLSRGRRRPNPAGGYDLGFDDDVIYTAQHWLQKKKGELPWPTSISR